MHQYTVKMFVILAATLICRLMGAVHNSPGLTAAVKQGIYAAEISKTIYNNTVLFL